MDERERARHGHPRQRHRRGRVRALSLSALKEERVAAVKMLKGPPTQYRGSKTKR